jgi:hypothetical protein
VIHGPDFFVKRAAGSYLLDLTVVGFPPLKVLITLGADGTFSSEDTTDYGVFAPVGGPSFESHNRGAWQCTGRHEVTFNSVGFSYAADGSLVGVGRLWGKLKFGNGMTAFSSAGQHDFFLQGQDPLDPDSVPDDVIPWTATGRRIPAFLK